MWKFCSCLSQVMASCWVWIFSRLPARRLSGLPAVVWWCMRWMWIRQRWIVLVGHVCLMVFSASCAPSVVTTSGGATVSKSLLYNQVDTVKPQT